MRTASDFGSLETQLIEISICLIQGDVTMKCNIRPADLARRMKVLPQEVNRLLSLDHKTKIDTVALALLSLGRRFELPVA